MAIATTAAGVRPSNWAASAGVKNCSDVVCSMAQLCATLFGMGRAQNMDQSGSKTGELLPDWRPVKPRSENWLREGAGALGYPTTSTQFRDYQEAGLLPEPDEEGRYPECGLTSLIRIRAHSHSVRSIPRRVVLLRADFLFFPVPTEKLRRAMVAMIPTIEQPVRKLGRVSRVLGPNRRGAGAKLPRPDTWAEILVGVADELFEMRSPGWYAMAMAVLPANAWPEPSPLWGIPTEDQIVLMAILDLGLPHEPGPPMIKR